MHPVSRAKEVGGRQRTHNNNQSQHTFHIKSLKNLSRFYNDDSNFQQKPASNGVGQHHDHHHAGGQRHHRCLQGLRPPQRQQPLGQEGGAVVAEEDGLPAGPAYSDPLSSSIRNHMLAKLAYILNRISPLTSCLTHVC